MTTILNILNFDLLSELIKYLPYKYYFYLLFSCKTNFNNNILISMKSNYFIPKNKSELYNAVILWNDNEIIAKQKYGDISIWNTEYIDNMSFLFYDTNKYVNIKDWIFYNVKDIRYMIKTESKIDYTCNYENIKKIVNRI